MDTQRIASYRREFSALADLQAAGTVTYSLLREEDAFVICVQRDEEPPVERMLCDTGEERAGMLTRFLYENAVEPDQMPAILRLFAFGSRLDRDTMQLFARTHSEEVRAAAIASTGQEVLELLHGGLRPQVLVLDALLTKPAVTQVLQEIGKMDLKPEPAVLVLVPVPEETAARRALGLFSRYEIMLRPYGMKNLFDEIYRMGTDEEENRLYRLRRCCEDVLESYGAPTTLNGYRYAERMLLYALYADKPQPIGVLQQYVATEEDIEVGTVTSALNRLSAGMARRGTDAYRALCLRCGRPEDGVLSNGQLFKGMLQQLRGMTER